MGPFAIATQFTLTPTHAHIVTQTSVTAAIFFSLLAAGTCNQNQTIPAPRVLTGISQSNSCVFYSHDTDNERKNKMNAIQQQQARRDFDMKHAVVMNESRTVAIERAANMICIHIHTHLR